MQPNKHVFFKKWLGLCAFTAKVPDSNPSQGIKIPLAMQRGQNTKQNSMVLAQKQTHRSKEPTREIRNELTLIRQLIYDKGGGGKNKQ